jgi:hypothetical protein
VRYGRPQVRAQRPAGTIIGRPFHPRNQRFLWQLFFLTTDDTDVHRLRTFGSTLMLFLLICGILFIRLISGSLATVLFNRR